ncbi:MAG: YdcH family protein [Alphaproteobacteria bacterium]
MTVESHLTQLNRKHEALEKQLEDAMRHPATGDDEIAHLKREKLRIKDEIANFTTH